MNPKIILKTDPSSKITCSTPSVSNEQELNMSSSSGFLSEYPHYSMNANITGSSLSSRKVSTDDEFLDPNIQEALERIRRLPTILPKVGQEMDTFTFFSKKDELQFFLQTPSLSKRKPILLNEDYREETMKDSLLSLVYLSNQFEEDHVMFFYDYKLRELSNIDSSVYDCREKFREVFYKIKSFFNDLMIGNSVDLENFNQCLNELVGIKNQLPKNSNYYFIERSIYMLFDCIYSKVMGDEDMNYPMSARIPICDTLTEIISSHWPIVIQNNHNLWLHRAIVYAAKCNEESAFGIFRKLIEKFDLNFWYTDCNGNTAIHYAALLGNAEAIRLMINKLNALGPYEPREGQDIKDCVHDVTRAYNLVNKCNQNGDTSLHCAVKSGSLECVQLLLEAGAECERKNFRLQTPLEIARNLNFQDIAALIEEAIKRKEQDAYTASSRRKPLTEEERTQLEAIKREYESFEPSVQRWSSGFIDIAEKYKDIVINSSRRKPLTEEERTQLAAIRAQIRV